MKKIIAILGGGAWGTAFGIVASANNKVRLWVRDKRQARRMQKKRENKKYLPGAKIPESVVISPDLGEVLEDADLIIIAVPSFRVRDVLKRLSAIGIKNLPPLLGLAKGMEKKTLKLPSEIVEDVFGKMGIPCLHLAGAGFATQIASGKKVTEVLASTNKDLALELQQVLETPQFRILLSDDIIGVQVGGTLKNVLAIAVAMVEETSKDKKIRAKIMSLCLGELIRVGVALGGKEETLLGSTGKKDLFLTASPLSRNYRVGKMIVAEGIPRLKEEIRKKKLTSEGIKSAEALYQICCERGISAPIIKEIALVVSQKETPEEAAANLINLAKQKKKGLFS